MRYVNSGEGKIPLISLIAILSISLTVNLPGLAVSPIEGKLHEVFKSVSDLQIQLLEVLPNVVVIPVILLTGKIATPKNQIGLLALGLIVFALSGLGCVFAGSINLLITLSCILGLGCGIVIPLAASLISQYFVGAQRANALGKKSGLSNFAVILGTLFVGWIAEINWHLAFIIYLVPLVPLALIPFMSTSFLGKHRVVSQSNQSDAKPTQGNIKVHLPSFQKGTVNYPRTIGILMLGLTLLYIAMTYGSIVVSYYVPFTMQDFGLDSSSAGVATAMYYLSAFMAGFSLPAIKRILGASTLQTAMLLIALGLFGVAMFHTPLSYSVSIFVVGFGYGIIQPVIYDKTTQLAPTRQESTRYFSYLLSGNYIGISIVPFIVDGMRSLFHATQNVEFPYWLNGIFVLSVAAYAFIKRKGFVFNVNQSLK